jgi:hypothetical protein
MQRVCDAVGAKRVQLPFAVEQDHRRLRRFIDMSPKKTGGAPSVLRPLNRHPLFGLLSGSAYALMRQIQPSVIITHNHVGEYGHIEHVLLHYAVAEAARRYGQGRVLNFGVGLSDPDLVVRVSPDQKDKLYEEYMPQWNGRRLYDFALSDESFVLASSVDEDH